VEPNYFVTRQDLANYCGNVSTESLRKAEKKLGIEPLPKKTGFKAACFSPDAAQKVMKNYGVELPREAGSKKPCTITVCNQKGGVGKTTMSLLLALRMSSLGYRTLVVDLDPQGNSSVALLGNQFMDPKTKVLRDVVASHYDHNRGTIPEPLKIAEVVQPSMYSEYLDVIPSTPRNTDLNEQMAMWMPQPMKAANVFNELNEKYDVVIFDSSPQLGFTNQMAFARCDLALFPVTPDKFAQMGLDATLNMLRTLTHQFDIAVPNFRIVFNQVKANSSFQSVAMQSFFDDPDYGENIHDEFIKECVQLKNLQLSPEDRDPKDRIIFERHDARSKLHRTEIDGCILGLFDLLRQFASEQNQQSSAA